MDGNPTGNDSILVVDDTPVNLKLVKVLLSRQGFQVQTAATGEEALQLAQDSHPRLILADIRLPGIDGLELTRRLKADPATRGIVVVALTAFAMENDEQDALKAGCDGYITKPIDTRTFPATIRQYFTSGSASAKRPPSPPRSDTSGDLSPEKLHQWFLAAGLAESGRVTEILEEGFRRAAELAARRWIGLGGSIGYPEISQLARELETVLQQETPESSDKARAILIQLARLFGQEMSQQECSIPVGLHDTNRSGSISGLEALTGAPALASAIGKRFRLIGFSRQQAELLSLAVERVGGVPQIVAETASAAGLDAPDLSILNVTEQMKQIPKSREPRLLIGPQDILLRLQPAVADRNVDYLFSPWTSEEAILRACFTLLKAGQAASPIPADANQESRVLIVDQDFTVTALAQSAMRNWGVSCRVAQKMTDALPSVLNWAPHVVLLDLNLLDTNDAAALASLRNEFARSGAKLILMAEHQQESDIVQGFQLGADDYILKPFTPMDLKARLKRLNALPTRQDASPVA